MTRPNDDDRKAADTLIALHALQGNTVHQLLVGGFLVSSCRWCQGWYAPDLKALQAMLQPEEQEVHRG